MIGKRFSSDDAVLGRFRRLQKLVKSLRTGSSSITENAPELENVLQREIVEDKVDDYVLNEDDFGKMLTMTAAGAKTFTLPAVTASDVGLYVVLGKLGAGKVTIQAAAGETIDDSSAGGTLYNDLADDLHALVRLKVIAAGKWLIEYSKSPEMGWRTS